jgi:toxin ParE1/3/4
MKLEVTPRALGDVRSIALFSRRTWGAGKAREYVAALWDRIHWLADNPMLGRIRDDVHPNYRSYRQGSHLIFYVVLAEAVRVIGIPHTAMDVAAYFDELDT